MHHWLKMHLDYFLFPVVFATILWFDASLVSNPFAWIASFTLGLVLWTLAEYLVHRFVLHGFFWHGTHEHHHDHPLDDVAFPLWYVPVAFALIFLPFYHLGAYAAFGGFVVGYVWFMTAHYVLHHKPGLAQTRAIWHNRHHKLTHMNYGVTTDVWDKVFGTSR